MCVPVPTVLLNIADHLKLSAQAPQTNRTTAHQTNHPRDPNLFWRQCPIAQTAIFVRCSSRVTVRGELRWRVRRGQLSGQRTSVDIPLSVEWSTWLEIGRQKKSTEEQPLMGMNKSSLMTSIFLFWQSYQAKPWKKNGGKKKIKQKYIIYLQISPGSFCNFGVCLKTGPPFHPMQQHGPACSASTLAGQRWRFSSSDSC